MNPDHPLGPAPTSPWQAVRARGQALWLDDLRPAALVDGSVQRMIEADGLSGMTSNPTILDKAIAGGAHGGLIESLRAAGWSARAIYDRVVTEDLRRATQLFRPVYERSQGADGFVSLEVPPHLAQDPQGSVAEALRLRALIGAPNLMIKVPGTAAALPAVRALVRLGVPLNVTLLFSVSRYEKIAEAYLAGLEDRLAAGSPLPPVASVASFFLSRIDTAVDARLVALGSSEALALRGRAAMARAHCAYAHLRDLCAGERWQRLAAQGARPQRLLWASTATKNPADLDVKYVEPLIAADTVTTVPPSLLSAFRDHGRVAGSDTPPADWQSLPAQLRALGIDLDALALELEQQGLAAFTASFDALLSRFTDPGPQR